MAFNTTDNPDITQTGWLTASKGSEGNQAFGELFKGISNTLENTAQAYDTSVKTQIQMDATAAVDQTATAALPPSLQKDIGAINSMKASRDQGGMTDIEFKTKVANLSKTMRRNYPSGYGDVIEGAISSALGTSTANQLREAALQEQNSKTASASAEEKQRFQYLKDNEEVLSSAQGLDLYKSIYGKDFNPQTADIWEMQAVAAAIKGRDYQLKSKLAAAGADKDAAKSAVSDLARQRLRDMMAQGNGVFSQMQKRFQELGADGQITDDERAILVPMFQQFKAQYMQALNVEINNSQHPGISKFTAQDRADAIANAQAEIDSYEAMLASPTPKQLQLIQDANKLTDEMTRSQLLSGKPAMRWYTGMLAAGFKAEELDLFLQNNADSNGNPLKAQLDRERADSFNLGVMSGQFTIKQGLAKDSEWGPKEKLAALNNLATGMANKTVSPETAAQVAEKVFSDDFSNALDEYAKNDPIKLFKMFVNPEVSAKLLATDGPAKARYIDWANRQSIPIMRNLGKLLENAQSSTSGANIVFENGRFKVVGQMAGGVAATLNPVPQIGAVQQAWEASKVQAMSLRVAEANAYIDQMEPIWKATGFKDTHEAIVTALGTDPTQVKKEGSWVSQIYQFLFDAKQQEEAPAIKGEGGANDLPGNTYRDQLRAGIEETAAAVGIDPIVLATAISYETAGTFDPKKKGPKTQWGQHKGLIQWGEPQAEKYGVNWDDPVTSQLGADGAIVKYLRDAGVKPGMGLLDVYSAINAGSVGRYNASDANNGGAPGTVKDKVNKQMRGHMKKALELFGDA